MKNIDVWVVTYSDNSVGFWDREDWAIDTFVESVIESSKEDALIRDVENFNEDTVKEEIENYGICDYVHCKIVKIQMPTYAYIAIQTAYEDFEM